VNFRGSGNQITGDVITDITAFETGFAIDFSVATTTASPATRSAVP
jgi:hypothetical protein